VTAPDIGQNNREIYEGEVGLSKEELARLVEEKIV